MAFATALMQVILAAKNKTSNFVFGIISVLCYVYIFYDCKLYADACLNVYYFIISIYGIIAWQNKNTETLNIKWLQKKEWVVPTLIIVVGFQLIYFIQLKYTNNTFALSDSLVAAFAWCGTYLMTRRKIENWILLNISNVIAIPLYYQKDMLLTVLLTIILFMMAIVGFLNWQKQIKYEKN